MCGIWAIFGLGRQAARGLDSALKISQRGPDLTRFESIPGFKDSYIGFHRLSIMDDAHGLAPVHVDKYPHLQVLTNGAIFNWKELGAKHGLQLQTSCNDEVITHLLAEHGVQKTAQWLDGVFSFIAIDKEKKKIHLARDTFGVRPMFTMTTAEDQLMGVCSEAKGMIHLKHEKYNIQPFPPGCCATYDLDLSGKASLVEWGEYTHIGKTPEYGTNVQLKNDDVKYNIRALLREAVRKRLMGSHRVGTFLSGGFDSSLVSALVAQCTKESGITNRIRTFTIGIEGSPDVAAARTVASHIGSDHHEVMFTPNEGIKSLHDVIYALESYDTATIRSSLGMYLVSKYISENTDTVVVFSGDGSDEVTQGYTHFNKAPTAEDGDKESRRLLKDLYLFDVLRGDRTTAAHGLEVRVPFLDIPFISYYLSLPASDRHPQDGIEKHLLRAAHDINGFLPPEILWKTKRDAFGPGASHLKPWFEILYRHVEQEVTDKDMRNAKDIFPDNTPKSKEAFFYRRVFEDFFPGHSHFVPYIWVPKWESHDETIPL